MDTMLDGARSSSRKAGAYTRPGSSLRKDYVEWMFICFWLLRRRAAVINVELIYHKTRKFFIKIVKFIIDFLFLSNFYLTVKRNLSL